MRKALSVLAALAALGATSTMAAGMNSSMAEKTTGTIKSIDKAKNEVILQDGKTFDVNKSADLTGLKPGEKVTVTYMQSGKTMDATQIKPAA
jgi:Cu/Ag efflux protein CusF